MGGETVGTNRVGSAFHVVLGMRLSITRHGRDPRNILMGRYADYFNRFLITNSSCTPLCAWRLLTLARNYVHEAFLETIFPNVRLWPSTMRLSMYVNRFVHSNRS